MIDMVDEETLAGGVDNAGAVTRIGDHVLRPTNPFTSSIHRLLGHLDSVGFDGAPTVLDIEPDGRERLVFVPGDVAIPPFPEWVQTDAALVSVARLVHRFQQATVDFDPTGLAWSDEMADPIGGPVMCHGDVCLENVVFRDGEAVALLDFDFVAPGRAVFDMAATARYCVPIDDPTSAARNGWIDADRPARLRLLCDTVELGAGERGELLDALLQTFAARGAFVRRRVEAGEPGFVAMWNAMGGAERFERRWRWWNDERHRFAAALG